VQLLGKHAPDEDDRSPNKLVSLAHRIPLTLGKRTNYKAYIELQLTISRGYLSTLYVIPFSVILTIDSSVRNLLINNPTKKMESFVVIKKNESLASHKKEKVDKSESGTKDYSNLVSDAYSYFPFLILV
jgi:hypothetical protein